MPLAARSQARTIDPCADRCRLAAQRMSGENSTTGSAKLARPNPQGSKLRFKRDKTSTRNFISDKTKGSSLSSAATTQSSAPSPSQHAAHPDGAPFDDSVSSDAASGFSEHSRWPTPDSPAGPVCKLMTTPTPGWLAAPFASFPVPSACDLLACLPLARSEVDQGDKLRM